MQQLAGSGSVEGSEESKCLSNLYQTSRERAAAVQALSPRYADPGWSASRFARSLPTSATRFGGSAISADARRILGTRRRLRIPPSDGDMYDLSQIMIFFGCDG
jgi:hypothetical protein